MRAILGFGLLAAGVAVGAQYYRQPEDTFARVMDAVPAASGPVAQTAVPEKDHSVRTFSPRLPAFAAEVVESRRRTQPLSPPIAATVTAPSATIAAPEPTVKPDATTPPAVVAAAPVVPAWPAVVSPEPAAKAKHAARPTDEEGRRQLVRNLQQEMKRVGCYEGEITGLWTPSSKRAMTLVTERVNSALPVDEPDYILLALLRGQSGSVCGKGCPTGQSFAADGRCLPNAIVAQQATRKGKAGERPATAPAIVTAAPAKAPAMPVAAPAAPAAVAAAPIPEAPAAAPLPGRMAIGGPLDGPMPDQTTPITRDPASAATVTPAPTTPEAVALPPPPPAPKKAQEHRAQRGQTRTVQDIFTNPLGRP